MSLTGESASLVCLLMLDVYVLEFDLYVFVSFLDDDLTDMGFVDFFVVEAIFLLEDISEGFTGVVEVCELVGEPELIVYGVGRFW